MFTRHTIARRRWSCVDVVAKFRILFNTTARFNKVAFDLLLEQSRLPANTRAPKLLHDRFTDLESADSIVWTIKYDDMAKSLEIARISRSIHDKVRKARITRRLNAPTFSNMFAAWRSTVWFAHCPTPSRSHSQGSSTHGCTKCRTGRMQPRHFTTTERTGPEKPRTGQLHTCLCPRARKLEYVSDRSGASPGRAPLLALVHM